VNPAAEASRGVVIGRRKSQSRRQRSRENAQATKPRHVNDFSQLASAADTRRRTPLTPPFGIVLTILDISRIASCRRCRRRSAAPHSRAGGDAIRSAKSHPHVDKVCTGGEKSMSRLILLGH
jgi:hypothetical protein